MRFLQQLNLRAALTTFRHVTARINHLAGWKLFIEKIGQPVVQMFHTAPHPRIDRNFSKPMYNRDFTVETGAF